MARLRAYIGLLHLIPIGLVLLASGLFLGLAYRGTPPMERLVPFLAAMLLTQIGVSFHNHYWDRELDARTKPWRAVPAGFIAPALLHGLAWALFATGVLVAAELGFPVAALVAFGTLCAFAYNRWLKGSFWSWVPFWLAMPTLPVAAFTAAGAFRPALLEGYLIGIPLVIAIHLADSLPDITDDRAMGVRGLPQTLDVGRAWLAAWGCLAAAHLVVALASPRAPALDLWLIISLSLLMISLVLKGLGQLDWPPPLTIGSEVALSLQRPILLGCAGALAVSWLATV